MKCSKLKKDLRNICKTIASSSLILDSGTLLGFIRNGDYISNDLDLDLSCTDEYLFAELVNYFSCSSNSSICYYKEKAYKISIEKKEFGTYADVDIKYFIKDVSGFYVSPAIGTRSEIIRKKRFSFSSKAKGFVGGIIKRHCDLGKFPISKLFYHDSWIVPANYFENLQAIRCVDGFRIPSEFEHYLKFRYGDWKCEKKDWVSHRDDGGYRKQK